MFMPGAWFLWSKKNIIIIQKEKENTFTLLTLNDADFWEVFFSEKWSLSYQIVFQMKI